MMIPNKWEKGYSKPPTRKMWADMVQVLQFRYLKWPWSYWSRPMRPMQASNMFESWTKHWCQLWHSPKVWMPNIPRTNQLRALSAFCAWCHWCIPRHFVCFSDVKKGLKLQLWSPHICFILLHFASRFVPAWRKAVQHAAPPAHIG